CLSILFFFFQAEDGIRDRNVTGVQTCALPIYEDTPLAPDKRLASSAVTATTTAPVASVEETSSRPFDSWPCPSTLNTSAPLVISSASAAPRSDPGAPAYRSSRSPTSMSCSNTGSFNRTGVT